MPIRCGIYKIVNKINGHYYIGSSVNIDKRWVDHLCAARKPIKSSRLYAAMNKYGPDNFYLETIESCSKEVRLKLEQVYIDEHFGRPDCYNISKTATSSPNTIRGEYTEQRRNNISNAKKGQKNSLSSRQKQSNTWKQKIADPLFVHWSTGRVLSTEEKRHRSQTRRRTDYFNVIDPHNNVYTIEPSLNSFAKKHGLTTCNLHRLVTGKALTHKGWRATHE
jgi:group I intron endonuclease